MKLTEAQRRVLGSEPVVRWFDVWGGYSFTIGTNQEPVRKATIDVLLSRGFLVQQKPERVFSGCQKTLLAVTDAGRAALLNGGK